MTEETVDEALWALYCASIKEKRAKGSKEHLIQYCRDMGASTVEIAKSAEMSRQGVRKSLKRLDNRVT